jgi:two-component system sensor kinase FixL
MTSILIRFTSRLTHYAELLYQPTEYVTAKFGSEPDWPASGLLAAVVASSEDAIISKDLFGKITSWNKSAERIFGYTAGEAIGRPTTILSMPGNEDEMRALLARVSRGERVDYFETVRRHKDGRLVHVSVTISPIHGTQGEIVGASKIARDITASKAAAGALECAEKRLLDLHRELLHATRLQELGQMAATLAHEINQPLSAIASYIAGSRQLLVQHQLKSDVALDDALRMASDQVTRVSGVVRRLRGYAKPSAGAVQPESLDEIVAETAALAAIDTGARGVKVDLMLAARPIMVVVDRVEIQQILLNLMRNAYEAMIGQDRRILSIAVAASAGMAEIRVSDTGVGIDPGNRDRLFLPFATTKADGMGLGLSICRNILDACGGKIWAEHPATGGAAFVFLVPLAR